MKRTTHDRLSSAIGIIQREILAADTTLIPEAVFKDRLLSTAALEEAERLLSKVLSETAIE